MTMAKAGDSFIVELSQRMLLVELMDLQIAENQ